MHTSPTAHTAHNRDLFMLVLCPSSLALDTVVSTGPMYAGTL